MHSVGSQVRMPRKESPTEVAHSMEAAAVPEVGPEENDRLDAMTVAEPEMEVDVQGSDPEPEHADDLADFDEFLEEVNDNSEDTRQAVLPLHLGFLIDHAQESFST